MKTLILSTIGIAGVGGIGWGLMPDGEVYPLSARTVESKLRAINLPIELGLTNAAHSGDVAIEGEPGRSVIWRVRERGETVGMIEAELDAVDDFHTRVTVDFRLAERGAGADTAALLNRQGFVKSVGVIALGEAIDATLEDRDYDKVAVNNRVMRHALTHPADVAGFKAELEQIAERARDAKPSDIDSEYQAARDAQRPEVGAAIRQREAERATRAAGAPMLDPSGSSSRY